MTDLAAQNAFLIICFFAIEIYAVFLGVKLFKKKGHMAVKLLMTLVLFIPFLGPIFYLFISDDTPAQPRRMQNRSVGGSNLWGWGSYGDNKRAEAEYRSKKNMEKSDP